MTHIIHYITIAVVSTADSTLRSTSVQSMSKHPFALYPNCMVKSVRGPKLEYLQYEAFGPKCAAASFLAVGVIYHPGPNPLEPKRRPEPQRSSSEANCISPGRISLSLSLSLSLYTHLLMIVICISLSLYIYIYMYMYICIYIYIHIYAAFSKHSMKRRPMILRFFSGSSTPHRAMLVCSLISLG